MSDECDVVGIAEVAEALHLSRSSIRRLVQSGHGPAPLKLPLRALRWRRQDLDRWVASCAPLPTEGDAANVG